MKFDFENKWKFWKEDKTFVLFALVFNGSWNCAWLTIFNFLFEISWWEEDSKKEEDVLI